MATVKDLPIKTKLQAVWKRDKFLRERSPIIFTNSQEALWVTAQRIGMSVLDMISEIIIDEISIKPGQVCPDLAAHVAGS